MTDKKKTEELNEAELDQVTGGLFSTSAAGTDLKKAPGGELDGGTPKTKGAGKGDGWITFGAEGTV